MRSLIPVTISKFVRPLVAPALARQEAEARDVIYTKTWLYVSLRSGWFNVSPWLRARAASISSGRAIFEGGAGPKRDLESLLAEVRRLCFDKSHCPDMGIVFAK
jgi:hypothetical protein